MRNLVLVDYINFVILDVINGGDYMIEYTCVYSVYLLVVIEYCVISAVVIVIESDLLVVV